MSTQYQVVQDGSIYHMAAQLNSLLADGWELYGPMVYTPDSQPDGNGGRIQSPLFCQPIVKHTDKGDCVIVRVEDDHEAFQLAVYSRMRIGFVLSGNITVIPTDDCTHGTIYIATMVKGAN